MSKVLNAMAPLVILGLAMMGSANARALNHYHPHPGYAGPASASHEPWEFVLGRGIVDDACDLPSSTCPNDERISN